MQYAAAKRLQPVLPVRRPATFERQFAVFDRERAPPSTIPIGFRRHVGTRLVCAACPTLPVVRLLDGAGQPTGFVLGDPIDLNTARVLRDAIELKISRSGDVEGQVEALFERLGGSFVIVIDGHGFQHIYLDACGSMSLVFDPERHVAAATTGLLLDEEDYEARFEATLYTYLNVLRDGWFPAGLTAHTGIVRQLVNHRLDLATMRQSRHWPREQIAISDDPHAAVAEICRATRAGIDALRAQGPIVSTLTAGNETRMLLSMCRDIARDLAFVTVDGTETRLDATRAEEIAQRHGLDLRKLAIVRATDDGAWAWHARAGHCIGGPNMWTHPSVRPLVGAGTLVGGLGGEIGRGFFWRTSDAASTHVGPETIVGRFGMPSHPQVLQAVARWYPSVTVFDPFLRLDLAYLELRMGCWAFAQAYVLPEVPAIHPMISRRAFASMLALPVEWRRNGTMIRTAIAREWPELLDLPINRYGDYRDTLRFVECAVRQPHLVLKKARKLFA